MHSTGVYHIIYTLTAPSKQERRSKPTSELTNSLLARIDILVVRIVGVVRLVHWLRPGGDRPEGAL